MGELLSLPVIHLDREYWLPGWVEPDRDEWRARVAALASGERWIMDGNYGGTMEARLTRADTVIFMDYARWLCMYRVTKRAIVYRNRSRPDMTPGCDEKVDLKFYRWIWSYRRTRRPGIMVMLRAVKTEGKRVVVLRSPGQTERFLAQVPKS